MKRDSGELSARQRLALPIIAAEPTVEGAAEKIGVTRKTIYEWLKREAFKDAVDAARKDIVESGFRTMRAAVKQAVEKIIKHLDSSDEKVSLRAAEDIVEYTQKAIELEDFDKRLRALEEFIRQGRNGHGTH